MRELLGDMWTVAQVFLIFLGALMALTLFVAAILAPFVAVFWLVWEIVQ